jgi:4-amino-4-deoxy-L-arabinose transferase-like glycosyltransferase
MQYILIGGGALIALMLLYQMLRKANVRRVARWSRWVIGGALAALSAFLIFRGQVGIASITGPLAFVILRYGRIGNFSFEGTTLGEDNASSVKSRFISMTLDHDSGTVEGRVVAGAFKGANLMELGEEETRQLLAEVASDSDSLALLETWLDKNRAGWRDYFAGGTDAGSTETAAVDPDQEAYEILGLKPGATADEVREAHHKLMKGVHPDQGGSNYLAAKINGAKDRLLRKTAR